MENATATRPTSQPAPQETQQQARAHGGRVGGRGGRGGRGRGRTGAGGRTLVDPNNPGRGNLQKLAPNTGIPYGHVPAYLPGSSSLVEELDQRIMVVLRDGRHLVGNLRTFDQYSNMVLDNASERRFHSDESASITYYTDVPLGMYIVRGDSVVLLGEVGPEEEESTEQPAGSVVMKKVDEETFESLVEGGEDVEVESESPADGDKLEWDFDKDLLA